MLIPFKDLVPKYKLDIRGILHLGAHTGEESEAYEELGIKNVLWVEADRAIMRKLKKHVPDYNETVCAVVGPEDNAVVVFNKANNEQSSSILELGVHRRYHPEVSYVSKEERKTTKVDTLMKKTDLDINMMNIDLQGAELLALQGATNTLEQIDYIYTEVNDMELYKGCVKLPELDAYLKGFGYKRVETVMTNAHWGDALYVKGA